jgi:hypothetical protein
VALVRHVTSELTPTTDVLTFDVTLIPGMHCRMEDRTFGVHLPDCIAAIAWLTISFKICESEWGNGG